MNESHTLKRTFMILVSPAGSKQFSACIIETELLHRNSFFLDLHNIIDYTLIENTRPLNKGVI